MEINNEQDMINQVKKYAASYTPEWAISIENPDVGEALLRLFATQMAGNKELFMELPNEYYKKFIQLSGLGFRPPKPAVAVVLIKLIEQSVQGLLLRSGTQFTAMQSDEQEIVFESNRDTYITESAIDTIISKDQSGQYGLILGEFQKAVPGQENQILKQENFQEFCPFKRNSSELAREMLVLGHSYLFCGEDNKITLSFSGEENLLKSIEDGKCEVYYFINGKKIEIPSLEIGRESLTFLGTKELESFIYFVIRPKEQINGCWIKDVMLYASGGQKEPDFVCTDVKDCDKKEFEPFGESLSLYSQCYIGSDVYFSKEGARISLSFDYEIKENRVGIPRKQDDNLKIIKRKSYYQEEYVAKIWINRIVLEYYTGKGWKNLPIEEKYSQLFFEVKDGHVDLHFLVPKDWEKTNVGAYEDKSIRMRIVKAENCYYQPSLHYYPVIRNLQISYDYENNGLFPEELEYINGVKKTDLLPMIKQECLVSVFLLEEESGKDEIYLGFEKKLQGGPVSIWIEKKEESKRMGQISFLYFGRAGWKRMKVIDHTEGLTHSGIILFMPPQDMEICEFQGNKKYFLCIQKEKGEDYRELVSRIAFNGVEVTNAVTGEEEDFYIDVSKPDMTFSVNCGDLISAEIWVNETGEHTENQMKELKEKFPEQIRIETNYMGVIKNFYVKWSETLSFEQTENSRVYRLDRVQNQIVFGDGIHKKIPKVVGDVAFKMIPCRCNGEDGNVGSGRINDTKANIMFVDQVENPYPAFGGSSMETEDMFLQRGCGMLSSHGRLITKRDYIREIKIFSDLIQKVEYVVKKKKIYLVLLMKDYENGTGSFYKVKQDLKKYLRDHCQLSISSDEIEIIEPIFVEIHISVWLRIVDVSDIFGLTMRMKEKLAAYLNPTTGKSGDGWDIGVLPQYSQLLMQINTWKENAIVNRVMVTASYKDERGIHECELEKMREEPFAVIRSGTHYIYTE